MLTIRMQRTGRTGHAQFRMIVQDRRAHPKSGRVVAYVGSYNPHSKTAQLDKERINEYLTSGAQPSDRVARLLQKEGIKLPRWFKASAPKKKAVRNPDKRRSTRPAGAPEPAPKPTQKPTVEEEPAAEAESPTAEEPTAAEIPTAESKKDAEAPASEETPAEAEEKPSE